MNQRASNDDNRPMNPSMRHLDLALSDDEFDRLGDFLDTAGASAMNLEMLDGYFCALICGPEMALPSESLPQVWGEDFDFEDADQASDIIGLIMRH